MNIMLLVMFLCVGLGMLASRVRVRLYPVAIALGTILTAVYLLLPRYV